MNILTDTLPKTVEILGRSYPIQTDFRVGVEFEITVQENPDKLINVLMKFFDGAIPEANAQDIFSAVEWFYCCGSTEEKETAPASEIKQGYSFSVDSNAIFADFWNYYNIDLSQEGLHWWAFRSLLEGLPDESEFKQRIYYRTCSLKGLTKKEKDRIEKIRKRIEIKKKQEGKITLEERDNKMLAYMERRRKELGGGGNG